MTKARVFLIGNFNFARPKEWMNWIQHFECFTGLTKENEMKQIHTLLLHYGDEAEDILSSFYPSVEEKKKYALVVRKFNSYFIKQRNIIQTQQ